MRALGVEGKAPPHDLSAEAAVLGALMFDGRHFAAIPAALTPKAFYSEAHGRVFEAIGDLVAEQVDVSPVTVGTRLRETGRLPQAGGVNGLIALVDGTAILTPSMFDRLVKVIVNAAALRDAATVLHEALARIYTGADVQASELIADTERKLQGFAIATAGGELAPIRDALRAELTEWKDRADGKGRFGIPSGFTDVDRVTGGFQRGDLIVLAARPGMGKTSFITGCAVNVAKRGDATAIFSLEMPAQQLAARMLCTEAGLSVIRTRAGKLETSELTRAMQAIGALRSLDVFVDDASKGRPTVAEICARTRRLAADLARKGRKLGLVIVDYMQIVRLNDVLLRQRHELAVGEVSTELKSLAKELETTVIGVAQLNRGVESRSDKRPGMADLRDSGQIEQDADLIAMLYRDEYYNPRGEPGLAEFLVEKNRNGPTGTVKLRFDGPTTSFSDYEDDRGYEAAE